MISETHILPHGYSATIETDDDARNPWKDHWDGCPPILVFNLDRHHGRLEDYGTGLCLRDIFWKVPVRHFGPKGRVKILEAMRLDDEEAHRYLDRPYRKQNAEAWKNAIAEILPENPSYWSEAKDWFEMLEMLCNLAKIPCRWEQSTGYSQGDAAWVFVAATPEWVKEVGWSPAQKDQQESLQADLDLWSAWAWGDVYGYSEITRPDGTELNESCWGYYGDDHEKSGLLEACRGHVEYDLRYLAKEAAEAFDAACRDITTAA